MTTTVLQITSDWTEVVLDTVTIWNLQNTGVKPLCIRYEDTATPPAADATGLIVNTGEGLTASIHGAGNVYAKAYFADGENCELTIIK